ncbi:MAG: PRC-barrel domain-containing protein [Planctomycetota bacterium]
MTQVAHPRVLSATSLIGDTVKNSRGEELGSVRELMIDLANGRVAYAVLSFGGFLGFGDKLFAIPWSRLTVDTDDRCVVFDVAKEELEAAEGFDKDNWPDFTTESFHTSTYGHWRQTPYWRS